MLIKFFVGMLQCTESVIFNLFCPQKKMLPQKLGTLEEFFSFCLDCPNGPKMKIHVGILTQETSVGLLCDIVILTKAKKIHPSMHR